MLLMTAVDFESGKHTVHVNLMSCRVVDIKVFCLSSSVKVCTRYFDYMFSFLWNHNNGSMNKAAWKSLTIRMLR